MLRDEGFVFCISGLLGLGCVHVFELVFSLEGFSARISGLRFGVWGLCSWCAEFRVWGLVFEGCCL